MTIHVYPALILSLCTAAVTIGCSKKQTKVGAESAPMRQETLAPHQNEHAQSDEDVVVALDADEKMREILLPVYFQYDTWDLGPESIDRLEKIAAFLREKPVVRLLIEGHADERGNNEYNIGLGENRATAVKEYLLSYGINPSRLEHTSYGRERPAIANCEDEECHGRNRRVEWKVLAK